MTSAVVRGGWSASRLGHFVPGKRPGIHFIIFGVADVHFTANVSQTFNDFLSVMFPVYVTLYMCLMIDT